MEIKELHLKHYGKFKNHRIALQPGINIIYGRNETGKTTIHSFIRAMFFGLEGEYGGQEKTDEYSLRQPWDDPSYFAGSMTLREDGELYQIDRNFDREQQACMVFDQSHAAGTEDGQEQIRQLLGDMSEAAFCGTLFVRQASAKTAETLQEELRGFMVNYDQPLNLQADVSKALQSLQKKKKQFVQKKKAEEQLLEEKIQRRQSEADYVRREIDSLKKKEQELQERPAEQFRQEDLESGEQGNTEDKNKEGKYRVMTEALLVIASILAFAMAWLFRVPQLRIFLCTFAVIFLLLLIPIHKLLSEDEEEGEQDWTDEKERQTATVREQLENQEDKYQQLQRELELLYQNHMKIEGSALEIEALNLAIDRITGLSSSAFRESGGDLVQKTSEILAGITGGRYIRVLLDDSLELQVQSKDKLSKLHELSFGTVQQVYFALRVAAGELLAKGKQLPLILDEPFAMYDDARLAAVLKWLYRSGRQVILFTCQDRERRILEKIKAGEQTAGRKKSVPEETKDKKEKDTF